MSGFDPGRVRSGEWLAAGSGALLLVDMLLLPWYRISGVLAPTATELGVRSLNGWHGLAHLRWLLLVTIAVAVALPYFQGTRPAPALPVALSVITTVLGVLSVLGLLYRVVLNVPDPYGARAGAYLGLAFALALAYGGFRSLRMEGIAARDAPAEIETVRLDRPSES